MYTTAQLIDYYTNLTGVAPDAATRLTLDAYALQTQYGGLTDAQALANVDRLWRPPTPVDPVDPVETLPPVTEPPTTPAPVINSLVALKTYYAAVTRTDFNAIGGTAATTLKLLADSIDGGSMNPATAQGVVSGLARQTTSVVNLTYQFFTGSTPFERGLDYLINSPAGLASAAFQAFGLENRYINFSINLGKFGEGQARFAAAYGELTLVQALIKAYAEIFGGAPTEAQARELLDAQLVIGDQIVTRAQYFALYGQDGANGVGTKAAMVGWLLAEAVKAGVGPYATAQEAFLADLGQDGVALFHVDLLDAYGPHVAAPTGATISFGRDQSVSTTSVDPRLRASDNSDVILGDGGLDADHTIATGNGDDRLTIKGVVDGKIRLGDGDSIVTLFGGVGPTGSVVFGRGDNIVYLIGEVTAGASISAAGTQNTLHLTQASAVVRGSVTGFQTIVLDAPPVAGALSGVKGAQLIYDMVPSSFGEGRKVEITAANHETVVLKNTSYGVVITDSTAAGADNIVVHLDHFTGARSTKVDYGGGSSSGYAADGGSITIVSAADVGGRTGDGKVTLQVDSDSTAGMVFGYVPTGAATFSAIRTLELRGAGKLTAQVAETFTRIDASRGGDFDLTYAVAGGVGLGQLKSAPAGAFIFSNGTDKLSVVLGHAADKDYAGPMKFVLGAGADTIVVAKGALGLNNLAIVDGTVFVTAEFVGFKTGVDHLILDAVSHGAIADVQAVANSAVSLNQAFIHVGAQVAANALAVFTYGGDTYVYLQDDVVGLNMGGGGHAGDGLIKLTGVTGLSVVNGPVSGDIHWG